MAVFTSGELAMERAMVLASAVSRAPQTWMVISFLAPSPSRAIFSRQVFHHPAQNFFEDHPSPWVRA